MIKVNKLILGLFIVSIAKVSYAESLNDFTKQTEINGNLRAYYFMRDYANADSPNQDAFSLGGQLNVLTSSLFLSGLRMGLSGYFAQPLGLNKSNSQQVDNSLPGFNMTTLGQAFLQYQTKAFLLRAGNQLINTPWLNAADTRIIPATYQGLFSTYSLSNTITLTALRVFRYKDRTSDNFSKTNLYNPDGFSRKGVAGYGDTTTNGALAFGVQQKLTDITTQAWYYKFYDLANLFYTSVNYESNKSTNIKPLIGAQFLRQWGDGKNLLKPYAGGAANTVGYGVLVGAKTDSIQLTLGYNYIPANNNAFSQGNILSPYTAAYTSDPLYTNSMIAGLIDKGAGQAVKLAASYSACDKQLQLSASYAKYFTNPRLANTDETDFDIAYSLNGRLKGLTIRNRIGVLTGNKSLGQFFNNRLMLQYSF